MFLGDAVLTRITPLEECQIELEYDIYISNKQYHDITAKVTMHTLVTNKLYPCFKQRGFKVLIRDELYAGRKLYSEISEAFFKTRNIMVLLSTDYCVDFYKVFEFNVAAMEDIYTKRQVINPITKKVFPWVKCRGLKVLMRDELYAGRKLYVERKLIHVIGRHSVNPYHPLDECQIELEYDIYT